MGVWFDCLTSINVKSGFRSTGIYPIERTQYPECRFNERLLKRYEKWEAGGRKEKMEVMAKCLVTPKK